MKNDILKENIKVNNSLILPGYITKNIDKLNIDIYELILLLYFINQRDNITFDISKISSDLNIESSKVLDLINSLNEKNYIEIEMKKSNGVIEEFVSIDLFYNKISSIIVSNKKEEDNNDIYSLFENEFGRTISATEVEIIDKWIESDVSEELIKEALKEAVLSGVRNMRYVDSILANWIKKGYKVKEDIKRKKEKNQDEKIEIYDYDWLNE